MNFPVVLKDDYGIRPAGKPDECFFCHSKVGEEHKSNCAVIEKIVRVQYTYTIDIAVPHHWDAHNIEFHRNESSWCADNSIDDLVKYKEKLENEGECLCFRFNAKYISDVDDTPIRAE